MLIKRKRPVNFNIEDASIFNILSEIELPEPSLNILNWSIVFNNGILIDFTGVNKQSLLYNSRLKDIGGYSFILKSIFKLLMKRKISVLNSMKIPIANVINEWANNYFHWFTEVLPKIYFLKKNLPEFVIILPSSFNAEYQLSSLRQMNIAYDYFEGMALIKKVYLPDRYAPYSAHYNPAIIKGLSNELKMNTDLTYTKGDNIYVSRRNARHRKIINEQEVVNLLSEFNFTIIDFESFTLEQQISIAHNAKVLISIHGAGLTNIMFCKAGTPVLEFSLANQTMDKCYYTLADACDLNYYYQFCQAADGSSEYHSANLIVDLVMMRKNLTQIFTSTP